MLIFHEKDVFGIHGFWKHIKDKSKLKYLYSTIEGSTVLKSLQGVKPNS